MIGIVDTATRGWMIFMASIVAFFVIGNLVKQNRIGHLLAVYVGWVTVDVCVNMFQHGWDYTLQYTFAFAT